MLHFAGLPKRFPWLPIGNLVVQTLRLGGHPPRLSQSLWPLRGRVNKEMKVVI